PRDEFDSDPEIISLQNGIYHIAGLSPGLLEAPHTPDHLITKQLPVVFDPGAYVPELDKFFSETFDEANLKKIRMAFGDLLLSDYQSQQIYVHSGGGGNGKGVVGNLMRALVGPENFASIRLKDLADNRFARAGLYGKMVNFGGDISTKPIEDWALVRSLSGG